MANIVIMPKQGQSVESCIITKWHKKTGDDVKTGDLLFSYETDKAAFDYESEAEGKLLAITAQEGDDVPCLNTVCIIGNEGEDISALLNSPQEKQAEPQEEKKAAEETKASTAEIKREEDDRLFISPRAKNAAIRQGVDASEAIPTGANGRVMERDIYALSENGTAAKPAQAGVKAEAPELQAPAAASEYTDEKLSNVRKVIARTMHESLSNMAQLTNNTSFNASELLEYRKKLKENGKDLGLGDITINDMILFAVSRVLMRHQSLNAHFLDDKIRTFHTVNLGIAVDTDRGLLVPTLFNADKKSLSEISKESKTLIEAARSGRIDPSLLSGGTFTVTNLGSLGVESFTPVINPPQTAILGVCAIQTRVKEAGGNLKSYPAMGLSLTYDHRAVDGAPAARFAKELATMLENFSLLIAM